MLKMAEIKAKVEALRTQLNRDLDKEQQIVSDAVFDLVQVFLETQVRIAEALEKKSTKRAGGYGRPQDDDGRVAKFARRI